MTVKRRMEMIRLLNLMKNHKSFCEQLGLKDHSIIKPTSTDNQIKVKE